MQHERQELSGHSLSTVTKTKLHGKSKKYLNTREEILLNTLHFTYNYVTLTQRKG